jgi:hypothetical protein
MIASSLRRNLNTPSPGATTMFMQIADRLSRLTRLLPQPFADVRADEQEQRETGWHESSWVMSQGLDVIELPHSAAATLFPDTQPAAYYDPIGDREPLAA